MTRQVRLPACVATDVRRALEEDLGDGDRTASLITAGTTLDTHIIAREAAILCGTAWCEETYRQLPGAVSLDWCAGDGEAIVGDQVICRLSGDAATVLSGERVALNFLQTLSGTATATKEYVEQLKGTSAQLLDTRKTLPGLRAAQKYAVRCAGGVNHRMGLFDAILIKENHIAACGSIAQAVATALQQHPGVFLEVEVETLEQLNEARDAGAQRVLLDNFSLEALRKAVAGHGGQIELEASGNITLKTIRAVAQTGVDYISSGAITKHVRATDLSMRFIQQALTP